MSASDKQGVIATQAIDPEINLDGSNPDSSGSMLRGHVDGIIDARVCGWLYNPAAPNQRLHVEMLLGDRVLATGIADRPRADLSDAGMGDGAHAFALQLDASLFDGRQHALILREASSHEPLRGSPILFCDQSQSPAQPRINGQFDRVDEGLAYGWAYHSEHPEQRLQIAVHCQDQVIARGIADRFRQDLLDAEIGDGAHAFELRIDPERLRHVQGRLSARVLEYDTWLPGSPSISAIKPEPEPEPEPEPRQVSDQGSAPSSELEWQASAPKSTAIAFSKPSGDLAAQAPAEPGLIRADNPPQPAFENTRDTRFFFPSSGHAEALSRLFLLAHDRNMGIGVLTGEIGAGKTLLRTLLYSRLSDREHLRVSLENSLLDFDGLLLEILSQMQGERLAANDFPERYTRLAAFKRLLSEQVAASNRHLVILIDEAQQLSLETLEALKALTNISAERQNFLSLILIGQPELRAKLKQLPQVDQRVSLRFHLEGLDRAETGYYIRHRLRVAGFHGEPPINQEALDLIHQVTRGIPREINRLCKLALEHLLTHHGGTLDQHRITILIDDLRRHGALEEIHNEL